MNAQKVLEMIRLVDMGTLFHCYGMMPENRALLDEIYDNARVIEACDKYRDGEDREFWLWAGEEDDNIREQLSVDTAKELTWFHLYLAEHNGNRGLSLDGKLIIDTREDLSEKIDMSPLLEWILEAEKKCIEMIKEGVYSDFIARNLPYKYRSGVIRLSTYWKYVPEDKERRFGNIDPVEFEELKAWNEDEDTGWSDMTSNDYFLICDNLYDILGLKEKYPIIKESVEGDGINPKDYYKVYAANYDSAKPFLALDGDSAEAFDKFVTEGNTEHHTWEVCLSPDIHLYPIKRNGKYFVSLSLDRGDRNYGLLVHLVLEMRKRKMPIIKPTHILEDFKGEELVQIVPYGDNFDWRYARNEGIWASKSFFLPKGSCDELIKEIRWFPTKKWEMRRG